MATNDKNDIFQAKESFWCHSEDGAPQFIRKGQTIRRGHPLMVGREDAFEPIRVDREVR